MLRAGQMMVANAILLAHLGRDWRWRGQPGEAEAEDREVWGAWNGKDIQVRVGYFFK